jgi:hypothetical protein
MARCAAKSANGSVNVMLLLSLAIIVGLLALNMDGGRMLEERRKAQRVADAAALAAARDLYENDSTNNGLDPDGTAAAAARRIIEANGYVTDASGVTVNNSTIGYAGAVAFEVNIPPASGAFQGKAHYAEVIVRSSLQGSFAKFFTKEDLGIERRAATRGRNTKVGVLSLATSGNGIDMRADGPVKVIDGTIQVNSPDLTALTITRGSLEATATNVVGGILGLLTMLLGGSANTGAKAVPDPLAALPEPDVNAYPLRVYAGGTSTLQPGVYRGGISVAGTDVVTLQPGLYIMDGGGFSLSGSGSVVGNQSTIFNTNATTWAGDVSLAGAGPVTLSPPATGTYTGISLFQSRALTNRVSLSSNATTNISGTIYAPNADVRVTGNGGGCVGGSIIAKTIDFRGSGGFEIRHSKDRPKLPDVCLVE